MTERSETLRGVHSFKGLGYVEISGQLYFVCGVKNFDCGEGCGVRYLVEQIERIALTQERKASYVGTCRIVASVAEFVVSGKVLLTGGNVNGIPCGLSDVLGGGG